jgi:hypothetical protein
MTELDSDRARARALNTYLAALVVDGRGECLVSTLRSCPEGPEKVKLGARHYQLATPRGDKAKLGRGTDHSAFPASASVLVLARGC